MLSVVVYGRNDAYGYNLHKRATISLNCFGALLGAPDDEILFVDYNTPDDLPTFPEAIRDTLTPETRSRLRVLRVRSEVHRRGGRAGELPIVEPLARNIGVRRANPRNRWLLSTNTDIIVSMRGGRDFHSTLAELPPGFWQAPRVELPESVWEGFDRTRPLEVLAAVRALGPALHLDEIVFGNATVLFDGPGDFQLAERASLVAVDGFDERMDRGWHVDANLAVRLALRHGGISSLADRLFAYHCDHTRQVTPLHAPDSAGNCSDTFVAGVTKAELPHQRDSWGLAGEEVEEIRLDRNPSHVWLGAVRQALGPPQTRPLEAAYAHDSYDGDIVDSRHVLPFLADLFASVSRATRLGWAGRNTALRDGFETIWRELGFTQPVAALDTNAAAFAASEVFVFDFTRMPGDVELTRTERGALMKALHGVRHAEGERRREGRPPRRIIGVGVVHNRYERAFAAAVGAARTPFSTRVRVGFARPLDVGVDWLAIANRDGATLHAEATRVPAGKHCLWLAPSEGPAVALSLALAGAGMELRWRGTVEHDRAPLRLPFALEEEGRLALSVEIDDQETLSALWSAPEGILFDNQDRPETMLGNGGDWLRFAHVGTAGERVEGGVRMRPGVRGHAIYGPFWLLPSGRYRARFSMRRLGTDWQSALASRRPLVKLDARTTDGSVLGKRWLLPHAGESAVDLPFTIEDWHSGFPIELRLFTGGAHRLTITRLTVDRL